MNATDPAEAVNGKWGDDLPFVLLVDHGVEPANDSYLYAVVPGVNATEMRQTMIQIVSEALAPASVIRNDNNVQALVVQGGNSNTGKSAQSNDPLVQVVFRSPASAELPIGEGGANVTVSVDRPAVLMISKDASHWNISVAEATRADAKTLTISIFQAQMLKPGRYAYFLPVQPCTSRL